MKTLGQIAYEARLGGTRPFCAWEDFAPADQAGWERAAQAVIAAYEAQRQTCSANTGPKPTAAEPQDPYGNGCRYLHHYAETKVQS